MKVYLFIMVLSNRSRKLTFPLAHWETVETAQ